MRHTIEIVHTGEAMCVFPGDPYTVGDKFEKIFKRIAYTSERGIDWDVEQVAERRGLTITRGVKIHVDKWLYDKYMKV